MFYSSVNVGQLVYPVRNLEKRLFRNFSNSFLIDSQHAVLSAVSQRLGRRKKNRKEKKLITAVWFIRDFTVENILSEIFYQK